MRFHRPDPRALPPGGHTSTLTPAVLIPTYCPAEQVWVEDLHDGTFLLRSIPLHSYGISRGARVRMGPIEYAPGLPTIAEVVEPGSGETFQVSLRTTRWEKYRPYLEALKSLPAADFEEVDDDRIAFHLKDSATRDAFLKVAISKDIVPGSNLALVEFMRFQHLPDLPYTITNQYFGWCDADV